MNIFQKLNLARKLNADANQMEEGIKMKNWTKVMVALVSAATAIDEAPGVRDYLLASMHAHPHVAVVLLGITIILSLVHDPKDPKIPALVQELKEQSVLPDVSGIKPALAIALLLASCLLLSGQRLQAQQQPVNNLYAAGVSLNSSASPAVAGTALYAHLVTGGTYAFTVADFLPTSLRPFIVTSNIGVGIAQKIATIGRVPIYVPSSAGISFTGGNTGWSWTTGAMAGITVKSNFRVFPAVRIVKSSVSGGSGYQPIVSVLFGWGQ